MKKVKVIDNSKYEGPMHTHKGQELFQWPEGKYFSYDWDKEVGFALPGIVVEVIKTDLTSYDERHLLFAINSSVHRFNEYNSLIKNGTGAELKDFIDQLYEYTDDQLEYLKIDFIRQSSNLTSKTN